MRHYSRDQHNFQHSYLQVLASKDYSNRENQQILSKFLNQQTLLLFMKDQNQEKYIHF